MAAKTPITVAHGDGIGPEIMEATLADPEGGRRARSISKTIEIGEKVYLRGNTAGIEPSRLGVAAAHQGLPEGARSPRPQGGGFKSLNVTTRKTLGLYANVRPCVSYHPFVDTKHPGMDVVIVRENEEDLYAGIEYRADRRGRAVPEADHAARAARRSSATPSSTRARNNRKKVTCFTKDNIMKMTDGLFHKVFDEIARGVPGHRERALDRRHRRGQAGRHARGLRRDRDAEPLRRHPLRRGRADRRLGRPGRLGQHRRRRAPCSRPSTARRRAAPGRTWPTRPACCWARCMMLVHIGQPEVAERVHNAWLRTIEDGIHTYDIFTRGRQHGEGRHAGSSPTRWSRASGRSRAGSSRWRTRARRPSAAPSAPSAAAARRAKMETGGHRRLRRLAFARHRRRWPRRSARHRTTGHDADHDRQPRREGLARRAAGDLLHGQLPLPLPAPAGGVNAARISRDCSTAWPQAGFEIAMTETCASSTASRATRWPRENRR